MKRSLFFVICVLFVCAGVTGFAQQEVAGGPKVLIDFQSLEGTDVDFSRYPGAMAEGIEELKVDMSIPNWALCKTGSEPPDAGGCDGYSGSFSNCTFNSWAQIMPPFEIPFYEDAEGEEAGAGNKFVNKGVLRNVGTIKSISVRVTGRNFPHGFSISLKDGQEAVREMFLGYLDFDGWRTLTWGNPNYITDVKQRDLRRKPLYPETMPSIKFSHFTIYRHGSQIGGDFVTYIKDVQMVYDLAILETERDINDEAAWGILQTRRDAKRAAEVRRLGILQVLRHQEEIKMQHAVVESER